MIGKSQDTNGIGEGRGTTNIGESLGTTSICEAEAQKILGEAKAQTTSNVALRIGAKLGVGGCGFAITAEQSEVECDATRSSC